MEPVLFVMAILGCGESDAPCRELGPVETRYGSETACLAATRTELARRSDVLYPTVVAQCRRADARPHLLRGGEVMLPDGGELANAPPRFAARSSR